MSATDLKEVVKDMMKKKRKMADTEDDQVEEDEECSSKKKKTYDKSKLWHHAPQNHHQALTQQPSFYHPFWPHHIPGHSYYGPPSPLCLSNHSSFPPTSDSSHHTHPSFHPTHPSFPPTHPPGFYTPQYAYQPSQVPQPGAWRCGECEQRFPNITELTKHVSESHQSPTNSSKSKQFNSNSSRIADDTQMNLAEHETEREIPKLSETVDMIATERENDMSITDYDPDTVDLPTNMNHKKKQACTRCGKEFLYVKRLSEHMEKEHLQETIYDCDQCGKEYQTKGHLRRHIKTHTDIYMCPNCPEKFSKKIQLKSHVFNEHTIKKCDKCEFEGKPRAVRQHKKSKHEAKKYHIHKLINHICDQCGQLLTTHTGLRNHLSNHRRVVDCEQATNHQETTDLAQSHEASNLTLSETESRLVVIDVTIPDQSDTDSEPRRLRVQVPALSLMEGTSSYTSLAEVISRVGADAIFMEDDEAVKYFQTELNFVFNL